MSSIFTNLPFTTYISACLINRKGIAMIHWMAKLASHYTQIRCQYPEDKLIIVFDIDGTMLDLRYMMLHVLQSYDREYGTEYFRNLTIAGIDVHEHAIDTLLAR